MSRGPRKPSVCRYFAASGMCHYGDHCAFQHVRGAPVDPVEMRKPTAKMGVGGGGGGGGGGGASGMGDMKRAHAPYSMQRPPLSSLHSVAVPPAHHGLGRGRGALSRPGQSATKLMQAPPPRLPALTTSSSQHPQLPHQRPAPLKPQGLKAQAQVDSSGTTYFYSMDHQPSYMRDYTMYTQPQSHLARSQSSFFMAKELRQELLQRSALCLTQPSGGSCPSEVDSYHTLCPLESTTSDSMAHQRPTPVVGHTTTCYRAVSSKDGLFYCLRRVHGFRLTSGKAVLELEKWRKLQHTNLIALREMFTTKAFGDNSVVFVYDFHPGAESIQSRHLQQKRGSALIPEELLWEYVIQLVLVLRAVHSLGLALRCIHSTKVLLLGKQSPRLLVNCGGMLDILGYDNSGPTPHHIHQQEDLMAMGQLLLSLGLQLPSPAHHDSLPRSMDSLSARYSQDFCSTVQFLLQVSSKGPPRSIVDVLPLISGRVFASLERSHQERDLLEGELLKELENGRLFRLIAKLGVITERPEFGGDTQWAETGDRYLLKLFRDYLFHQVLPSGAPWVDLAHVVQTLNKLDVGSPEHLSLHSRDEQSVLVVSFTDLKSCLENTFSEVLNASEKPS